MLNIYHNIGEVTLLVIGIAILGVIRFIISFIIGPINNLDKKEEYLINKFKHYKGTNHKAYKKEILDIRVDAPLKNKWINKKMYFAERFLWRVYLIIKNKEILSYSKSDNELEREIASHLMKKGKSTGEDYMKESKEKEHYQQSKTITEKPENEQISSKKYESVADELLKLKLLKLNELKEKGILTEEEFEEQKKKLLKQ